MAKPTKHGHGWRIRYVDPRTHKRVSKTFRAYSDAKQELHNALSEGNVATPVKSSVLFSTLCEFYLKYHSTQKRNYRSDRTIIQKHLLPFLGRYPLEEVHKHLAEYRKTKTDLAPKTVHHQLSLLGTMLRVAKYEKNWLTDIPRIKKPKIKFLDDDYSFLKNPEEIERFLSAAKQVSFYHYIFYATALYTGMRAGELAGLQWEDIDFGKRLITVRRSYSGPTKNGETRFIPILNTLLPKLLKWRLQCAGKIVFPNRAGNSHGPSARIFQEELQKVLGIGLFGTRIKRGRVRSYIVFHDLRHTFASHWMMTGGDLYRLRKILGHADIAMTQRYSHLAPHIYEEDYDRLSNVAAASIDCPLESISLSSEHFLNIGSFYPEEKVQ